MNGQQAFDERMTQAKRLGHDIEWINYLPHSGKKESLMVLDVKDQLGQVDHVDDLPAQVRRMRAGHSHRALLHHVCEFWSAADIKAAQDQYMEDRR